MSGFDIAPANSTYPQFTPARRLDFNWDWDRKNKQDFTVEEKFGLHPLALEFNLVNWYYGEDHEISVPDRFRHPERVPAMYQYPVGETHLPALSGKGISLGLRLMLFSMVGMGIRVEGYDNSFEYETLWGAYGYGNYAFIAEIEGSNTRLVFEPEIRTPPLVIGKQLNDRIALQLFYAFNLWGTPIELRYKSGYHADDRAYNPVVDDSVKIGEAVIKSQKGGIIFKFFNLGDSEEGGYFNLALFGQIREAEFEANEKGEGFEFVAPQFSMGFSFDIAISFGLL